MKINELAQPRRSKQAVDVFESYFGKGFTTDKITDRQARSMLNKVRGMLSEHRQTSAIHTSQKNPAYMQLVMMENALRHRLNEMDPPPAPGVAAPTTPEGKKAQQDAANQMKQQQMQQVNKVKDPTIKKALGNAVQGKSMSPDEQQALANATMASGAISEQPVNELSKKTLGSYAKKASKNAASQNMSLGATTITGRPFAGRGSEYYSNKSDKRQKGINRAIDRLANESMRHSLRTALNESELDQAQVTLAAKDLSDRVQKMLEDTSSMQFKDLPALVDEIKNEVGIPQASQYSQQAGDALGNLVQAIQQAKAALDAAMGIVTGQEMEVPGQELAPPAEMGGGMPPEMPPMPEEPIEEPGAEAPGTLGRARR